MKRSENESSIVSTIHQSEYRLSELRFGCSILESREFLSCNPRWAKQSFRILPCAVCDLAELFLEEKWLRKNFGKLIREGLLHIRETTGTYSCRRSSKTTAILFQKMTSYGTQNGAPASVTFYRTLKEAASTRTDFSTWCFMPLCIRAVNYNCSLTTMPIWDPYGRVGKEVIKNGSGSYPYSHMTPITWRTWVSSNVHGHGGRVLLDLWFSYLPRVWFLYPRIPV